MDEAPNIKGDYPLLGERIGPAWCRAWDAMSDGGWVRGLDLAESVRGDLRAKTVIGLFRQAVLAGLLEVEIRRGSKIQNTNGFFTRDAWYRRADVRGVVA